MKRFTFAVLILTIFAPATIFAVAPANDHLANAEILSGASGAVQRSNAEATRQTGEPSHDTSATVVYRTVWFEWTAAENKPVAFEIAAADFDAAIAVHVGGNGFSFSESPSRNNDTFGTRPRVEFQGTAGKTYKIAVGLFNDAALPGGNFTLQWATAGAPTNDNFANALTLENAARGSVALTKQNATTEANEPLHVAGGRSVWFNYTNSSPNDLSMTFSTTSFDLADTTLSVYTGASVSALVPVVKNDNVSASLQSRVTFLAKAGVTYRIAVDEGTNSNNGSSLLNWGITKIKSYTDFGLKNDQTAQVFYDDAADISVFRPADGVWYWLNSSNNSFNAFQFGASGDVPVPGDYDGDGRSDIAVVRDTAEGKIWFIRHSFDGSFRAVQWGTVGDKPVTGDYDFDGRLDIAVFRPASGTWFVRRSSDEQLFARQFGAAGDIPVSGDFKGTGDGSDLAVFRPANGTWYVFDGTNTIPVQFGSSGDRPVAADYDRDGKTDTAVFRPASGTWFVLRSRTNQLQIVQWGADGDVPVTGDYDNNSNDLDDFAVFRPGDLTWYILKSEGTQTQFTRFGAAGDIPVSSPVLPAP